ncbi:NAD(P)-binding domain-containing protein [Streptomyces sp. NPDC001339]|uniref:NAD(P)-binding domain-containing protein n=1 Tax=Streptomyces sp. NPDC001339 TaxID=3364563 RepID=UPI00369F5BAF
MYDLVVVGAGPYGLSIAAHAAGAGLRLRVLGRPMAAWHAHMPDGMLLTSEPGSVGLSAPHGRHSLAEYCATHEVTIEHGVPLPLGTFAAYAGWFAERAVPQAEDVTVTAVRPLPDGIRAEPDGAMPHSAMPHNAGSDGSESQGFQVETDTGELIATRTVVLALGALPFAHLPWPLLELPPELASHSSDHRDLRRFAGRNVAVLGAGQSALETATLLAEQGARPCLVARTGRLRWDTPPRPPRPPRGARPQPPEASYAPHAPYAGLGTGRPSRMWSPAPWTVRRLPAAVRLRIVRAALGPAGAWWLRERFESAAVPTLLGHHLRAATPQDDTVRLHLSRGKGHTEPLDAHHVVAATGFRPDLRRLRLLHPRVRGVLHTVDGSHAPELTPYFESSWPGLFFAGMLAVPSFGPSMCCVHGTAFTAPRLLHGVQRRLDDRYRRGGRRRREPALTDSGSH